MKILALLLTSTVPMLFGTQSCLSRPCIDCDRDGYTVRQGDCDDHDNTVYPGAPELCDGKDNDCNPATIEDCGGPTGYSIHDGGMSDIAGVPSASGLTISVSSFALSSTCGTSLCITGGLTP